MRHIQAAGLAAAVALVFATAVQAAVPGTISTNRITGTVVSNAPRIPGSNIAGGGGATSSGTANTTTTPTSAPQQTNVDLRNQQTLDATAGTHASGSTSALGPLANGAASVSGATGTTSGVGATGTTTLAPYLATPMYANPSDSTLGVASTTTPTTSALASTDLVYGNASLVTEAQVNGVNVDRAINQVSRERKRVGRNGQLLYSIAPRTNVDRTAQMPDDGPSPALTGSNSTLTR